MDSKFKTCFYFSRSIFRERGAKALWGEENHPPFTSTAWNTNTRNNTNMEYVAMRCRNGGIPRGSKPWENKDGFSPRDNPCPSKSLRLV